MSSKIRILPDAVANHIAAGEVIERPASVVKELVENALDAGATHITVEIGVGGKAYIRVTDNGCGMTREDASLAFARHATSKIASTADLALILTLGFRGEALPSIASVAKVKLLTRTAEAVVGTRIDIQGGELLNVSDSGAAPGTFLEVNDLFYKTPARLKFLKSPATEFGYINIVLLEEALACPQVGFTLKNNGREQLHLPADSDLRQRIAGLFGRELIRELTEVHESAGSLEIRGLIGLPTCHRANRNYQKVFVNHRPVKDKTISHAIQQTYEGLIPRGRHPVAVLFLTLPPQLVDVNVHPTKMEIRFVNAETIHQFVSGALRQTLSAGLHRPSAGAFPEKQTQPLTEQDQPFPDPFESSPETLPELAVPPIETANQSDATASANSAGRLPSSHRLPSVAAIPVFPAQQIAPLALHAQARGFAGMKPLGQFHDTYLLVQAGEDLCIIDQHAAHERIFYEKLKGQFQQTQLEVQQLLFPVALELSHREQAVLAEHLELFRQYGLELEPFGGATYLLKAVPVLLAKADYKKLIYDLLDHFAETGKTAPINRQFDAMLMLMACHAAIRAHQPLQAAQISALLQQLDALDYPYTCPHGRPTVLKITVADLEKKFGRT